MGSDPPVTPEEAALALSKDLQHQPWFLTVGIGQETNGATALFVYTKSVKAARVRQFREWRGYKVYVKPLTARPANSPRTSVEDPPPRRHKDIFIDTSSKTGPATVWTNASVRRLMDTVGNADPVRAITRRARDVALGAMDRGWTGPPSIHWSLPIISA